MDDLKKKEKIENNTNMNQFEKQKLMLKDNYNQFNQDLIQTRSNTVLNSPFEILDRINIQTSYLQICVLLRI